MRRFEDRIGRRQLSWPPCCLTSISTPLARGRCTERNTFAYPQINDLQVLFLVRECYSPGRPRRSANRPRRQNERFAFEEFGAAPVHGQFLWGSGGLACALLIGRAFMARGWDFKPGDEREIGDPPAYTFIKDDERELQACAEQYLGVAAGELLMAAGLMPVMSHRHRNAVTVMRVQSVALSQSRLGVLGAAQ